MPFSRRMSAAALLCGTLLLHAHLGGTAAAQQAVVHGILIYDPTCENCEAVLKDVLPPLETRYGNQLDIVRIDGTVVEGFDIWAAGVKAYGVPTEKKGVPLLFLGDRALSGRTEIQEQLPGAVEAGIAAGGVPFPGFVTLTAADRARWAAHAASPTAAVAKADPTAFGLALVVLAGTVLGLAFAALGLWRARPMAVGSAGALSERLQIESSTAIPVLTVAGLLVAGYLSYLHLSSSPAICPLGNCDAVQHSSWALLFGVPVAYLGFLAYGALLGLWLHARYGRGLPSRPSSALVLWVAAFGTAFSAYLTTLELFVIRAVCMWCLTSAVAMTLILVAAAHPLYRPGRPPATSRAAKVPRASGAGAGAS